jgi:molybdopterin synthase sulfur carrier subunit
MTVKETTHQVVLRYFAWLREKTGISEERLTLTPEILTVADLLRWQASRGAPFDLAFAKPEAIRVALDRAHAKPGAPITGATEIAFFPPVTGG